MYASRQWSNPPIKAATPSAVRMIAAAPRDSLKARGYTGSQRHNVNTCKPTKKPVKTAKGAKVPSHAISMHPEHTHRKPNHTLQNLRAPDPLEPPSG